MVVALSREGLIRGRYRLVERLGHNVHRQTWLAGDERTAEQVVLKALAFDNEMQWQQLKLAEREAATLQSLTHPCIPRLVESFWLELPEGHYFCLVQSYIPGQSLAAMLRAGRRWSPGEVLNIARQVLEILDYLHSQSPPVVHRDIKPSNIILSDDGRLFLIDFGAVQAQSLPDQTVTVVGTFGYMAPEQFYGKTSPASDLYSLGMLLLCILTGTEATEIPRRGLQVELPSTSLVEQPMRAWFACMLAPEHQDRFDSAREALESLGKAETAKMPEVLNVRN
ncbi:serine/threonine kinase [Gloeobacter violaceus PCC 7421]|uniref:Serine/threonine kinase n=1 Tax=Gloeobacter violaceus (strain ATCC 29082 / PCC 7421) TaxID=251221 RepID=Q7NIQ6_GLOVI|nr:serine/threonine kinase [Gloeobacter violaceus PCC 7421]